jgi:hypothetical protein
VQNLFGKVSGKTYKGVQQGRARSKLQPLSLAGNVHSQAAKSLPWSKRFVVNHFLPFLFVGLLDRRQPEKGGRRSIFHRIFFIGHIFLHRGEYRWVSSFGQGFERGDLHDPTFVARAASVSALVVAGSGSLASTLAAAAHTGDVFIVPHPMPAKGINPMPSSKPSVAIFFESCRIADCEATRPFFGLALTV